MSHFRSIFQLSCAGLFGAAVVTTPALAEVRVAATLAPIHSLVAKVMDGAGEPALALAPGASPHDAALTPSAATALQEADLVFWAGENLETWVAKPIEALAGDAMVIDLSTAEGLVELDTRDPGDWTLKVAVKDDDNGAHGHDGHGHDDHGHDHHDHDHHDEAKNDEHGHDHGHGHDHDHGDVDPHLWLDPANAVVWVTAIEAAMVERDPANAERYSANADAARTEIEALTGTLQAELAPIKEKPYVVFHDAYQYFETRFDLNAIGAIALSDADRPGPARVAAIRDVVKDAGAVCVFAEPQFEPKLVQTVIDDSTARTGVLDPLGSELTPGPDLYPSLLRNLAAALTECLAS